VISTRDCFVIAQFHRQLLSLRHPHPVTVSSLGAGSRQADTTGNSQRQVAFLQSAGMDHLKELCNPAPPPVAQRMRFASSSQPRRCDCGPVFPRPLRSTISPRNALSAPRCSQLIIEKQRIGQARPSSSFHICRSQEKIPDRWGDRPARLHQASGSDAQSVSGRITDKMRRLMMNPP